MHGMNSKQPLRFSLEIIKIFMFSWSIFRLLIVSCHTNYIKLCIIGTNVYET